MQIAILKSILKYSFTSLVLVFCIGCPNHKKSSQPKANLEALYTQRAATTNALSTATKAGSDANPTNSNNSDENKTEIENGEKINSDDNRHVDNGDNQDLNSAGMYDQTNKEKKKAIEEEIKIKQCTINTLYEKIECIKNKIENLSKAIEISNRHSCVFSQWRLYWYHRVQYHLKKAGLNSTVIGNIKSQEDATKHLNQAIDELGTHTQCFNQEKEKQQYLIQKYKNL